MRVAAVLAAAVTVGTLLADTVSAYEVFVTVVTLVIVVAAFALAFGLVAWVVRFVVRRRRRLRAMLGSPWVWAAAGVFVCLNVTGNPRVALVERPLTAEQRTIADYYNGVPACYDGAGVDLDVEQAMVAAIQAGEWRDAAGRARRMRSSLRGLHICIRNLIPEDDRELRPAATRYARGLEKYVLAYDTYVRAIERGGDRGLDLADRRLEWGEDEAEAPLRSVARIFRSRGADDIAPHVDWEYMHRVFEERGVTRPPTA